MGPNFKKEKKANVIILEDDSKDKSVKNSAGNTMSAYNQNNNLVVNPPILTNSSHVNTNLVSQPNSLILQPSSTATGPIFTNNGASFIPTNQNFQQNLPMMQNPILYKTSKIHIKISLVDRKYSKDLQFIKP